MPKEGVDADKDFEEWFQSVASVQHTKDYNKVQPFISFRQTNDYSTIIDKIRNYPLIMKTPLETQQFLIEVQNDLKI